MDKVVYCRSWSMFLCENMSEKALFIVLLISGMVLAHIFFKIFNKFFIGKIIIYFVFVVLFAFEFIRSAIYLA